MKGTTVTVATPTPITSKDDELLRACLQRNAPDLFAAPARIREIQRSAFRLSTSYDTYLVSVRMDDGCEHSVFLKDFGVSARVKDEPRQRRERERRVYQEVLPGTGLGTPRCFGAVWDDAEARYWLLLEFVAGKPVGYCDVARWTPAAAALGRLHGYFAQHANRLHDCDFLLRPDADHFHSRAELALQDLAICAPQLVGRLVPLARLHATLVPMLADQPHTLLHGGCRGTNILIDVAGEPSRVCILDWEEASWGPPLLDVAYLLDGIESPRLDAMLAAYRQEALAYGLRLPLLDGMKYVYEAFRLHRVLDSLARAVGHSFKEKGIVKLLNLGEHIALSLSGRSV